MNAQVLGQVLGEVLGEVLGNEGMEGVGARRHHHHHRPRHALALPHRPSWRDANAGLPTGVNAPDTGLEPLPIKPDTNNGIFTATVGQINWVAKPQRPFRGERLLAQVLRSGASTAGVSVNTQGIFVGTQLQQNQIGSFNLEFFPATAFDVRLALQEASPGLEITIAVSVAPSGTIAGADFINLQLLLLGSTLR